MTPEATYHWLELVESQRGYRPEYTNKYSVCTEKEHETCYTYLAPFTDKNGHALWSDDLVKNDDGTEMILRFGPYTAFDDDGVYDGWGWYLQAGLCDAEGNLVIYQILPVCKATPDYITFVGMNALPKWYPQFLKLVEWAEEKKKQTMGKQEESEATGE